MMPEFTTNQSEMARMARVDRTTIAKWVKRPDFPAQVKGKGWPVKAFREYAKKATEAAAKAQTGDNAELKTLILTRKAELLQQDIDEGERKAILSQMEVDERKGLLVLRKEALSWVADVMTIASTVFTVFIRWVKASFRDSSTVAEAERLTTDAMRLMRQHYEEKQNG